MPDLHFACYVMYTECPTNLLPNFGQLFNGLDLVKNLSTWVEI